MHVAADGRRYAVGSVSNPAAVVITTRSGDETSWTTVLEDASLPYPVAYRGVPSNDGFVVALTANAVARLSGTTATVIKSDCAGTSPTSCARAVQGVFATSSGQARALFRSAEGETFVAVVGSESFESEKATTLRVYGLVPLPKGALATCAHPTSSNANLCATTDGETFNDVPLPSGDAFASLVADGQSPDDFYFLAGSGKIFHRTQGAWIEEPVSGLPAEGGAFAYGRLRRFDDGSIVGLVGDSKKKNTSGSTTTTGKLVVLAGGCWRTLRSGSLENTATTFGDGKILERGGSGQVCERQLLTK